MITERLELIPATVALCEAESRGPEAVGGALRVRVPPSWPPPVFEPNDVARVRRQLEGHPAHRAWTLHYLVLRATCSGEPRDLVGIGGYVGPPSAEGAVEIGYAIAAEHQRRGYATEAVRALIAAAFRNSEVVVVAATTYAVLEPSIGVLKKAGFVLVGREPASGLLRYEHHRVPGGGPVVAVCLAVASGPFLSHFRHRAAEAATSGTREIPACYSRSRHSPMRGVAPVKSPRALVLCGAAVTLLLSACGGRDIDDPCFGIGTVGARTAAVGVGDTVTSGASDGPAECLAPELVPA